VAWNTSKPEILFQIKALEKREKTRAVSAQILNDAVGKLYICSIGTKLGVVAILARYGNA
jgi:hypothetical protein